MDFDFDLHKTNHLAPQIKTQINLSTTNHNTLQRHRQNPPPPQEATEYKECLKNHAASIGGHAVDGCGEYMPPLPTAANLRDPTSLTCAACGCHRNFHRREAVINPHFHFHHHQVIAAPLALRSPDVHVPISPESSPEKEPLYYSSAPQMLLALKAGSSGPSDHYQPNENHPTVAMKKRVRTRFSAEQKDKMRILAEKIGWKLKKSDEKLVNGFCDEIGISRNVFKVWMHNNNNNNNNNNKTCRKIDRNEGGTATTTTSSVQNRVSTNGSSSISS